MCTQERGGQCKREGRFALKTDHASVSHTAVPDRSVHETLSSPSGSEYLLTLVSLDIDLLICKPEGVGSSFLVAFRKCNIFVVTTGAPLCGFLTASHKKKQVIFNNFLFASVC